MWFNRHLMNQAFLVAALSALSPCLGHAAAQCSVLVAGFGSDNVVKFDVTSGAAEVLANLVANDRPRGIAVDAQGDIYVSLRGGTQNVVKLIPDPGGSGELIPIGFTESIRGFGPGLISFNDEGELIVAGDASRVVFRHDGTTGDLIDSFTHSGCCNLVGLMVGGAYVYAGEYFQRKIFRCDLSTDPVECVLLISTTNNLDRPLGMTIGHTGNLFVANSLSSLIQEFDIDDGTFLGTFKDLSKFGLSGATDIHYDPGLGNYFISSGSSVYRVDANGDLIATYQSEDLVGAYGLAVVAEAQGCLCLADLSGPVAVPDGVVDAFDLAAVLGAWCSGVNDPNPPSPPCENCLPEFLAFADINGPANAPDGCVDAFDLAKLLAAWGPCL